MAKWANDLVMDAALDYIATSTEMYICEGAGAPADRAAAITASAIAARTLTGGSFSKANGDTNGRKVTVAQQATISVTSSKTVTHIALCTGSALIYVTTCTSQALTSGNTVTVPAWDVEISDPS